MRLDVLPGHSEAISNVLLGPKKEKKITLKHLKPSRNVQEFYQLFFFPPA